jgi:hypothetical protein
VVLGAMKCPLNIGLVVPERSSMWVCLLSTTPVQ